MLKSSGALCASGCIATRKGAATPDILAVLAIQAQSQSQSGHVGEQNLHFADNALLSITALEGQTVTLQ